MWRCTGPGGEPWPSARAASIELLAELTGVSSADAPQTAAVSLPFLILLGGLASLADWIASSEAYFPYEPLIDDIDAYARLSTERAAAAIDGLGWTIASDPAFEIDFARLFDLPTGPNAMQSQVASLNDTGQPGLLLIEAPTGEGKTEAALYHVAGELASGRAAGMYMAMPTQATANAMLVGSARFSKAGAVDDK